MWSFIKTTFFYFKTMVTDSKSVNILLIEKSLNNVNRRLFLLKEKLTALI